MVYNCYHYPNFKLQVGDLVFFKPKSFLQSNFISAVLESSPTDKAFYHVAMIVKVNFKAIKLIDVTPKQGVVVTEHKNLCKTHGFFSDLEVLRVNLPVEKITDAVNSAVNLTGLEYNDLFAANFINSKGNQSFYCSQIIQYVFNTVAQREIFPSISMSFKDNTGEISEYWKDYYELRQAVVPQDAPGSHPASIYESEFLMCF